MAKMDFLLLAVNDILFREWDPIGVNDNEVIRCRADANHGVTFFL